MKIINFTPHDVRYMPENGKEIIFPSEGIARVVEENSQISEWCAIEKKDGKNLVVYKPLYVNIVAKKYKTVVGLPKEEEGTLLIVSHLVLQAVEKMTNHINDIGARFDLIAPDTGPDSAIRDESGKIVGVKRFMVMS